jgi:hypothetical protein
LSPLASQSSALQSLKTSAKVLASSSSKAKTLSAPLPQRTQERLDRDFLLIYTHCITYLTSQTLALNTDEIY